MGGIGEAQELLQYTEVARRNSEELFEAPFVRALTRDFPLRLTPGPFEVSPSVQAAGTEAWCGHRTKSFRRVMHENRRRLLEIFGVDREIYDSVIITGTGTAAMECMIAATAPFHRVLVLVNGRFSRRLADIALIHNEQTDVLDFGAGQFVDLDRVTNALSTGCYEVLYFALQDTREALLNPYVEICTLAKRYGVTICVDAISAGICEAFSPGELDVDIFCESSGKGIRGLPGLGLIVAKKSLLQSLASRACRSYYLNLAEEYKIQANLNETRFAQAPSLHFALHQALVELSDESCAMRRTTVCRRSEYVRHRIGAIERFRFLRAIEDMPHSVTSILLPDGLNLAKFQEKLENQGVAVYSGSSVAANCFQIGTAGYLTDAVLAEAMDKVETAVRRSH